MVIWEGDHRLRQDGVVHLTQYISADMLQVKNKGILRPQSGPYTVRKGDTFKSISMDRYGTPNNWKKIMVAAGLRDPKKIITLIGKKIRIP
jgi:nucleoid-associated protein YgaU